MASTSRFVFGILLMCSLSAACGQDPVDEVDMTPAEEMGSADLAPALDMAPDVAPDQSVSCYTEDMQAVPEGEKVCVLEFYKQCLSGVLIGTTERCAPPPDVNIFVDIKSVTSKPFAGIDNVVYFDLLIENRGTMPATGVTCKLKAVSDDGTIVYPEAFIQMNDTVEPGAPLTEPSYLQKTPNNPRKKAKAELTCTCTNEQAPWDQVNNYDSYDFEW
jgi:hypothetical protein